MLLVLLFLWFLMHVRCSFVGTGEHCLEIKMMQESKSFGRSQLFLYFDVRGLFGLNVLVYLESLFVEAAKRTSSSSYSLLSVDTS